MSSQVMWDREQRMDDGADFLVATWRKEDAGWALWLWPVPDLVRSGGKF